MPEWLALTPWWISVGLLISIGIAIFKIMRWTLTTDKRLEILEVAIIDFRTAMKEQGEEIKGIQSEIKGIQSEIKGIQSEIKGIQSEIRGIQSEIRGIQSDIKGIQFEIREMRTDFKEMQKAVVNIYKIFPSEKTVEENSPIQLSELGREVSNEIDASNWAQKHALQLISSSRDKEEFEIFDSCVDYVDDKFQSDQSFYKTIRSTAYNRSISNSSILKVFQVELRNHIIKLLEENNNLEVQTSEE